MGSNKENLNISDALMLFSPAGSLTYTHFKNRGTKHRGPLRLNYPSNLVWAASQLWMVN